MYRAVDLETQENVAVKAVRKFELKPQQVNSFFSLQLRAENRTNHCAESKCPEGGPDNENDQTPVNHTTQKLYRD